MKKLYLGITLGGMLFISFLIHQNSFAENINQKKEDFQKKNSLKNNIKSDNQNILILEQKVKDMEKYTNECQKYIDASQKNLDLWLKYLTFTFSVLIGYSIFNGLKSRELAKDELKEIKTIKDEIKKSANEAEERLKIVTAQIIQIENTANNAKNIEEKMTLQLKEFGDKTDIALDSKQKKELDRLIAQTNVELQNNGIEAFKNLYYAKAIKMSDNENYEETIRLLNIYIDLDENNSNAYYLRGRSYVNLYDENKDPRLLDKAINDCNNSIHLDGQSAFAYNNKGTAFHRKKEIDEAFINFSKAIEIDPEFAIAYYNRSLIYNEKGELKLSEKDLIKAKELDPDVDL